MAGGSFEGVGLGLLLFFCVVIYIQGREVVARRDL